MIAIDHVLTRRRVATAADTFTAGVGSPLLIVDVAVALLGAWIGPAQPSRDAGPYGALADDDRLEGGHATRTGSI